MNRIGLIVPFLLLLALSSCEIINPSEELPAYIAFEQPMVEVDSVNDFVRPYNIRDAWTYQNGNLIGIHPIPETVIPYTNLDQKEFRFEGGVFESGLSNFRLPYPFWNLIQIQIDQPALDTFTVTPIFEYKSDNQIEFLMEEDFESGFQLTPHGPMSDTTRMHRSTGESFQGNSSGRVRFTSDKTYWEVTSTAQFEDLTPAQDPWLEVTYKTDVPIDIGMRFFPANDPFGETIRAAVTVLPKGADEDWSTIYVHLVEIAREANNQPDPVMALWFRANGQGQEGELFLDNLRLVHLD